MGDPRNGKTHRAGKGAPMKTISFGWSNQLATALRTSLSASPYKMNLVGSDADAVVAAVNQGIDSRVEACYVAARGDAYQWQFRPVRGRALVCEVSRESLPVLVRRLLEAGDERSDSLASSICQSLGIELI